MTNLIILNGMVGKDPEIRVSKEQMSIASFSLATSKGKKNQDGSWTNITDWHNCVAFGKTAEAIGKKLSKGDKAFIMGEVKTRKWQDKEGKDKYTTEVIIDKIDFLTTKNEDKVKAEASATLTLDKGLVTDDDPPF